MRPTNISDFKPQEVISVQGNAKDIVGCYVEEVERIYPFKYYETTTILSDKKEISVRVNDYARCGYIMWTIFKDIAADETNATIYVYDGLYWNVEKLGKQLARIVQKCSE
jgi:hypothetical protein